MKGRVVMLTPGHREPGGAQRRSRLFAEQLAARGWQVRAVTRAGSSSRPRLERSPELTVVEVPGFGHRRLGAALYLLVAIPLALAWGARATALVSVQLMSTTTTAAIAALLLRRPFLAMATTSGKLSEVTYLKSTRLWPLRRRLISRSSFLLAQTSCTVERLSELVPRDRIAILANPVRVPSAPAPLTGEPRVLFAGRLSAEKNLETLLDAWPDVVSAIAGARLTLAGSGGLYRPVEADLRERVAGDPALRASVVFTGWIEDLGATLESHDVFVLPSTEEGMSNALLEACAVGRVVVASDIPSNRTVLGNDYPLLFHPLDASSLADLVVRALSDPKLAAESRASVRQRVARFSADAVTRQLEELIDAAGRTRHQHA